MKNLFLSLLSLVILLCSGPSISQPMSPNLSPKPIDTTHWLAHMQAEQLFNVNAPLLNHDNLVAVLALLQHHLSMPTLDEPVLVNALHYLYGYSYFAEQPNTEQLAVINQLLLSVSKHSTLLATNHALQQAYASNVHRWLSHDDAFQWQPHLTVLVQLMLLPASQTQQAKQGQWENMLAQAAILRWLRKSASQQQQLAAQPQITRYSLELRSAIASIEQIAQLATNAAEAKLRENLWFSRHLLWLAAQTYLLMEQQSQQQLDLWAIKLTELQLPLSHQQQQQLLTESYLVPSFRTLENCQQAPWQNWCLQVPLQQVLPIEHACTERLFIVAERLSQAQLSASCVQLTSQENHFHQLFKTNLQAVPNDFNDSLRVVIFRDWHQYHRYAPMLFDINTDNGGMYIEGKPSKAGNQASFYAFEAFWLQPEFKVWNLNHEYVHYLTGRYTTYGGFGHFPDHMVWWSEGIAEYIAQGNDNPRALALLAKSQQEQLPSLERIFATEYADGLELTYQWSYWAVRYLAELAPHALWSLKHQLTIDNVDGYLALLTELAQQHQTAYEQWLLMLQANASQTKIEPKVNLHKMNRYLYPKYLTPDWLSNSGWYQHF